MAYTVVVEISIDAAAITAEFYKDGIWDHANYTNPVLKNKRDLTLQGLNNELSDICVWSHPVGGLFVWVRLPDDVDRKKLSEIAAQKGVHYLPGIAFHYENKNVPYIRLAFGHLEDSIIEEGIPVMAQCIRESRTSNESRNFDSLFTS